MNLVLFFYCVSLATVAQHKVNICSRPSAFNRNRLLPVVKILLLVLVKKTCFNSSVTLHAWVSDLLFYCTTQCNIWYTIPQQFTGTIKSIQVEAYFRYGLFVVELSSTTAGGCLLCAHERASSWGCWSKNHNPVMSKVMQTSYGLEIEAALVDRKVMLNMNNRALRCVARGWRALSSLGREKELKRQHSRVFYMDGRYYTLLAKRLIMQ